MIRFTITHAQRVDIKRTMNLFAILIFILKILLSLGIYIFKRVLHRLVIFNNTFVGFTGHRPTKFVGGNSCLHTHVHRYLPPLPLSAPPHSPHFSFASTIESLTFDWRKLLWRNRPPSSKVKPGPSAYHHYKSSPPPFCTVPAPGPAFKTSPSLKNRCDHFITGDWWRPALAWIMSISVLGKQDNSHPRYPPFPTLGSLLSVREAKRIIVLGGVTRATAPDSKTASPSGQVPSLRSA